jgi:branched-chain amino acid transport system ATP-binding protein
LAAVVGACARLGQEEWPLSTIAERIAAAGAGNAIDLRGVSRYFGALAALTDITLSVRPGERRAVLGSNGAGKTTLLNCVTGDFLPTSGTVRFFGEDVTRLPPHERVRRGLRRTYQISLLFQRLSVRDNVYLACRGVSRGHFSFLHTRASDAIMQSVTDLISLVHLEAMVDRSAGELAHGQQRQLELRVVESVTMMHNGRIFKEGAPHEIEADPEVQQLYLGGGHG